MVLSAISVSSSPWRHMSVEPHYCCKWGAYAEMRKEALANDALKVHETNFCQLFYWKLSIGFISAGCMTWSMMFDPSCLSNQPYKDKNFDFERSPTCVNSKFIITVNICFKFMFFSELVLLYYYIYFQEVNAYWIACSAFGSGTPNASCSCNARKWSEVIY